MSLGSERKKVPERWERGRDTSRYGLRAGGTRFKPNRLGQSQEHTKSRFRPRDIICQIGFDAHVRERGWCHLSSQIQKLCMGQIYLGRSCALFTAGAKVNPDTRE